MKYSVLTIITLILVGFAALGLVQSTKGSDAKAQMIEATPVSEQAVSSDGLISERDLKVQLTKALSPVFSKQAVIINAKATSIDGVYEVLFNEGTIIYTTLDGEYFFYGKDVTMYKSNGGDIVNLTAQTMAIAEKEQAKKRLPILQGIDDDDFVTFTPKGEVKASVIVFTDVDCGYCRKLHEEIQSYLDLGIEIKYAAFPRAGVGSNSYNKIVSAWCAPNQQETMTRLKTNKSVAMQTCDNPVAAQYQLGRSIGVTGTPSIYTEDGQNIPGYRAAKDLAAMLGI